MHGPHRDETLAGLREFALAPRIFDRHWTNRETGEVIPLSALARIDSADPSHPALLPLGEVAATLQSFQWELFPHLRGNRVDVASDHLVPGPCEVCDRIAELRLPYSRLYRGGRNAGELWLSAYHNAGRSRAPGVVVVHYPRLEALLHRRPEADSATIEYCRDRVRQEIRFRGPGLRRRFGGGPMTAEAVFGSFPALVQFAERRLRPVFDADILSPPPRDLPGEAALASVTGSRPGS